MNKLEMRKIFANNFIALLDLKKKTRKDISDDLKINYAKVCDWSRARTYPNEVELGRLARYFDSTIEQLTNGKAIINENSFDTEQATQKKKVSVIDISNDEWIIHPVDYEWVSVKHLISGNGYLIFDVADDLMEPKYSKGDTVMVRFLDNKVVKQDGDYLIKFKDYGDNWIFIHIYVKKDGYLVSPLNNNNSKSLLPKFYTKEEFINNAIQPHIAVRVSKNI
ncbi:MAG: hypothetical protein Q4E75_02750 [bacterium]|nr:hypothetical protein [bacterium]